MRGFNRDEFDPAYFSRLIFLYILNSKKVVSTAEPPWKYERGEFSININWDWRIERETKILFGSSNDRKEIQNGLDEIKNVKVI